MRQPSIRELSDRWLFHFGPLAGRFGCLSYWNADPSGSVCITRAPFWGKAFWNPTSYRR